MLLPTLTESKFSITERHRTAISSLCSGHWLVSYYINGKTRWCMKTVEVSELQDLPNIIHSALMSMTLWRCEEQARSILWRKLWRSLVFPDRKMLIAVGKTWDLTHCKKWAEQRQNRSRETAEQTVYGSRVGFTPFWSPAKPLLFNTFIEVWFRE